MKRFTETSKWSDPWFRKLSPTAKLLWLYLCDNCDQAGVIDLDSEIASVHIGATVDERVLEGLGNRVITLSCGKLFIPQFVKFQHGTPSRDCKAHNPIFQSYEKYDLERVSEGYAKGIHTHLERVQVKVEVKETVQVHTPPLEKKQPANLPTSEPAKRIAGLFRRRLDTPWSEREVKVFKSLTIESQDLDLLENYYATERAKGENGRHRRDLGTFLNNFAGELDRARASAVPVPKVPLAVVRVTETSEDRMLREFQEREKEGAA